MPTRPARTERRTWRPGPAPLAWSLVGLTVALNAVFALVDLDEYLGSGDFPFYLAGMAAAGAGGLVASRRPGNPIGWLFCAFGLLSAVDAITYAVATQVSPDAPESSLWAWAADIPASAIFGVVVLAVLLFPDGRLPSPRWKPVLWLAGLQMATGVVAAFLAGGFGGSDDETVVIESPFPRGVEQVGEALSFVFYPLTAILLLASVVGVVMRFRWAVGDEREQLKWFALAAAALVTTVAVSVVSPNKVALVLMALALTGLPLAMGVAILKYRLYDIDVVINKTIVFGALAAFITLVYVAVVAGVGALVGRGDEPDLALSVAATALVAVVFQPVRNRTQHLANRLVYGERASPYEVLSAFAARMGETAPTEELLDRMARLLGEGTGAAWAQVWLRVGNELRPAASWPEPPASDQSPVPVVDEALPSLPGADTAVPVTHHGELLGALAVAKARGETVSASEEKLIADVAAQAGLVLRNVRLTAELLEHVEELRASRQRLVTAQDDERRRLERDLHDGAQQQLAAMKINLGLARTLAESDGATGAAEVISRVMTDADDAVQTLRELAHGIYPPLLASEGLGPALAARSQKAPLPVTVEADGTARYPQEVEAGVYFCCLEALQNVVKYAEATAAQVRIGEDDGTLAFSVEDDGRGFDPSSTPKGVGLQNMADRLEALGGTLRVSAAPGRGTRISGQVPARPVRPTGPTDAGEDQAGWADTSKARHISA